MRFVQEREETKNVTTIILDIVKRADFLLSFFVSQSEDKGFRQILAYIQKPEFNYF